MRSLVLSVLGILIFSACKKQVAVDQVAVDKKAIVQYISDHKLKALTKDSLLFYVIDTQGSGVQPTASSNVTVKYKGYLTDGTVFDQNASYKTSLSQVIQGWTEGIPLFKKGGSGKLLIPSALGYGNQAVGSIPANSVTIFDITLLDVQ